MYQKDLRELIVSTAKKMNISKINQGTSGNLSVRVPGGLLITPSSIPYEELEANDIIEIDYKGKPISKEITFKNKKDRAPSSEWQLHADIFNNRNDINAILHCHSINATAIACHKKKGI